MSIEKFLDFITSGSLFFSPCGSFEDPLESTCSQRDLKYLESINTKIKKNYCYHIEKSKPFIGINCWHMNDEESFSMWNSYAVKGKGIVIESSCDRLIQSIKGVQDDIFVGAVDYIDYSATEIYTCGNEFTRFFKKDYSFSHEKELRAIKWMPKTKNGNFDYETLPTRNEYLVQMDVLSLVQSIRFSPSTPVWLQESIIKIARKFYPDLNLLPSMLLKKPPHLAQ